MLHSQHEVSGPSLDLRDISKGPIRHTGLPTSTNMVNKGLLSALAPINPDWWPLSHSISPEPTQHSRSWASAHSTQPTMAPLYEKLSWMRLSPVRKIALSHISSPGTQHKMTGANNSNRKLPFYKGTYRDSSPLVWPPRSHRRA